MKKLLSLAFTGIAFAALSQPIYAKPEKGNGKGKEGRSAAAVARGGGGMRSAAQPHAQRSAQQAQRSVQHAQRIQQAPRVAQRPVQHSAAQINRNAIIQQRAVANNRVQNNVRVQNNNVRQRVNNSQRNFNRTQPSVAFGGQTRAQRSERSVSVNRSDFRGDYRGRNWDRDGNRDRDWSDRRFRRPPITTYRDWDHGRIHSWNNHRWHWYNNAWVIVDASPDVYYYDYDYDQPVTTTYDVYSTNSTVADVQRGLAAEGYDPGPIDGVMGGQTRSAIAAFQRDNGMPATGRIDSGVLEQLNLR